MFDWVMKPKCPRFPDASLAIGKIAGWLYNFLAWFGIRLGLRIGAPLLALSKRARDVEWARKPLEDRFKALCVVGIGVMGVVLLSAFRGLPRTVGPPGKIA